MNYFTLTSQDKKLKYRELKIFIKRIHIILDETNRPTLRYASAYDSSLNHTLLIVKSLKIYIGYSSSGLQI